MGRTKCVRLALIRKELRRFGDLAAKKLIAARKSILQGMPSRLQAKLIWFFVWKHSADPEGLADETIDRLVAIVYAGEIIEQAWGYALGTARNVYREYIRKQVKLTQIDEDSEPAIERRQSTTDPDPFVECAGLCLQKLPDDKRLLIEQYYSEEGDREELAGQEGVSLAGLRTKIHRLKAELRECYHECMRGSSG